MGEQNVLSPSLQIAKQDNEELIRLVRVAGYSGTLHIDYPYLVQYWAEEEWSSAMIVWCVCLESVEN
ncbi:hypothetical protein RSAG8_12637, partial [Rhizoctonia solani AG-8 WAC10335]